MVLKWMLLVIGLGCVIMAGFIILSVADHLRNPFRFYQLHNDQGRWAGMGGNHDDDLADGTGGGRHEG